MNAVEKVRRWANKAFRQQVPLTFKVTTLIISPTDQEGVYQLDLAVHSSRTGITVTMVATFTHAAFLARPDDIVAAAYTNIIAQILKDSLEEATGPLQ